METAAADLFSYDLLFGELQGEVRARLCPSAAHLLGLTCKTELTRLVPLKSPHPLMRAIIEDSWTQLVITALSSPRFVWVGCFPHKLKHWALRAANLVLIRFLIKDTHRRFEAKVCSKCLRLAVRTGRRKIIQLIPAEKENYDYMRWNEIIATEAVHQNNVKILGWLASIKRLPSRVYLQWPTYMGFDTATHEALHWWDALMYLRTQNVGFFENLPRLLYESMVAEQWTYDQMVAFSNKSIWTKLGLPRLTHEPRLAYHLFYYALVYSNHDVAKATWPTLCTPSPKFHDLLVDAIRRLTRAEDGLALAKELFTLQRPPTHDLPTHLALIVQQVLVSL
jgi:hypothetical protein